MNLLLLKKLLVATVLGSGIITPIVHFTRQQTPIEQLEIESTLKKWQQLLSKISGKTDIEKITKLFSRNLTSFSKSAVVNTVKQLLMKWVIQIWENQEAFFPISQRLNKFFFYYHIHHWKMMNEVEENSWELIKKFFIDFFFKEKGWFFLSQFGDFSSFVLKEWERKEKPLKIHEWHLKYSNAGENKQASSDSESLYSKSTIEKVKNKIPFLFPEIKGSVEYSSFISRLTHKGEVELSKFKKKWITLSELTKLNDGYKLGALIHLYKQRGKGSEDRSALDSENESVPSLSLKKEGEKKDSWDPASNPLFLFLEKNTNENCLLFPNSIFSEVLTKQFQSSENGSVSCLYSARWLGIEGESGSDNDEKKQRVLASRELDGISFYYLSDDHSLQGKDGNKTIDEQDTEVIAKVTEYLTDNFEDIFFQYLLSKGKNVGTEEDSEEIKERIASDFTPFTLQPINTHSSLKIEDWNFSDFLRKHSKVLLAAKNYLESLYWAQNLKTLQNILLSVYKNLPETVELEKTNEGSGSSGGSNGGGGNDSLSKRIKLPDTVGLFSPLVYKRAKGNEKDKQQESTENKELDFSELRENGEEESSEKVDGSANNHKNWFFDELIEFLFGEQADKKLFSLEQKASELKELILDKNGEKLIKETALKDFFSSNLFFRAQLEDLAGPTNNKSIPALFTLKAEEWVFPKRTTESTEESEDEEELRDEKNSFKSLLESYIKSLKSVGESSGSGNGETTNTWTNLINESVFLEPFLKSTIEKKTFYGALDFGNWSSQEEEEEGDSDSKKKLTTRAKNHWLLDNYYFSDSAYEGSSEEYKKFLSYLLAVKWMVKENYANLPHLINYILKKNKNKNAYLLWYKEITEQEKEQLKSKEEATKPVATSTTQENGQQAQKPEEQLKKFLEEAFSQDISNPLLKGEFYADSDTQEESKGTQEGSSQTTQTKNYTSKSTLYSVDAYKNENGGAESSTPTKLSGFVGLITESFTTRDIPKALKDYIFTKFLGSNSTENTNYSAEKQTPASPAPAPNEKSTLIEGAFVSNNSKRSLKSNTDLLELLKKINKKEVLLKFLDKESANSLKIALEKQGEEDIGNLTLQKLKEELIKSLSATNSLVSSSPETSPEQKLVKELYKLFNRFSGYLWVSGEQEKSPYVFTETKENSTEKKYYIGFLYQLNQFDFDKEGIEELKKALSEKTLHTLISLLASNQEIREWIYEKEIVRQLFLSQ